MDNIQLCIPGILTCTPRVLTCIPGVPYLKTWYTLPAHPEYLPAHLDFLPGYLKYFTSTPAALCLYGVWSVHLHTWNAYLHIWPLTCTHGSCQQLVAGPAGERQGGTGRRVQTEGGKLLSLSPAKFSSDPQQVVEQVGHASRRPEDVQVGLSSRVRCDGLLQVQRVHAGPVRGGHAGQPAGGQGQQHSIRTSAVTWSSPSLTVT